MEATRIYRLRGTPGCPIDVYRTARVKQHRTFAHWHPELEIMFVEDGTTVYRLEGRTLTLHPKDILIIPPNTLHSQTAYTPELTAWSMVIATEAITMPKTHIFQKDFVEPLQQGRLHMPTVLRPGDAAHAVLYPLLLRLETGFIYEDNYEINRFSTAMAICTALLPFCNISDEPGLPRTQDHLAVRQCMDYIHHNYSQRLTLAVLAKQVQLHPNYLCSLFRAHTGQTLVAYIIQVRVEAAAQLLRTTDLPVNRVAEQCGFRSECLLYKYFKTAMGTTPIAYRNAPFTCAPPYPSEIF